MLFLKFFKVVFKATIVVKMSFTDLVLISFLENIEIGVESNFGYNGYLFPSRKHSEGFIHFFCLPADFFIRQLDSLGKKLIVLIKEKVDSFTKSFIFFNEFFYRFYLLRF